MRKVFNYTNWNESAMVAKNKLGKYYKTISACGCLFRKKNMLMLIAYSDPNYPLLEDFGGQVDETDNNPIDTIIRETIEETNWIVTKEMMNEFVSKPHKTYYNHELKYYNVIIDVDDSFCPDTKVFGNYEITDNIGRTVGWYDIKNVKSQLAYRLAKNKDVMDELLQ
jgi:hypothetical protein